jgi:hypothetical protein
MEHAVLWVHDPSMVQELLFKTVVITLGALSIAIAAYLIFSK